MRKARFDLDDAEIKPYFLLENMVRAMFDTATRLFGVKFREISDLPLYHPDAKVYEVVDALPTTMSACSSRTTSPGRPSAPAPG